MQTRSADQLEVVRPVGDTRLVFTAPFHERRDSLATIPTLDLDAGGGPDLGGGLMRQSLSFASLISGSMTYDVPPIEPALSFRATPQLVGTVHAAVEALGDGEMSAPLAEISICGILADDLVGSVAVSLTVADGWDPECFEQTMQMVGPQGRDQLADLLRELLLPALTTMLRGIRHDGSVVVELPYFNLTYGGRTDVIDPGRHGLQGDLRCLVYPNGPGPLVSQSTWKEEFFYPGYAFNLLFTPNLDEELERVLLLLLLLDVLYCRLARAAAAADAALRRDDDRTDVTSLSDVALQLRTEYQALVTPTFSYDFHVLSMRDAILHSWHADRLQRRSQDLLVAVRQVVEQRLADKQGLRVRAVNRVVIVLTVLSAIATVDSAVALYERFWG